MIYLSILKGVPPPNFSVCAEKQNGYLISAKLYTRSRIYLIQRGKNDTQPLVLFFIVSGVIGIVTKNVS